MCDSTKEDKFLTFDRFALLVDRINRNEWDPLMGPEPESRKEVTDRCGKAYKEIRKIVGIDIFLLLLDCGENDGFQKWINAKRIERTAGKQRKIWEDFLIPALVSAAATLIMRLLTQ